MLALPIRCPLGSLTSAIPHSQALAQHIWTWLYHQTEPPAVVLTAAAATRSKANAVKLSNPAQLHGFMPTSVVTADPNTSAGGRPEPLRATAFTPASAVKALADALTRAVF